MGRYLGVVTLAIFSGCATAPAPIFLSPERWAQEVAKRGVDPRGIPNPLLITPEMASLAEAWAGSGDPPVRLERLQRALFDPQQFPFTYFTRGTLTAAEAFFRREGNCLSFTNLFVALGRALGIPVTTGLVTKIMGSEREGDLIVVNTHTVAVLEWGGGLYIYDFDRSRTQKPVHVKPLDDLWITALYLNNRGADELRLGHPESALFYFQAAVRLAPEFAPAWANVGVARRRVGDIPGALEAYGRALTLEPSSPTVAVNLAALFRALGKEEEAQQALRLADLRQASPHLLLVRGDVELAAGRVQEAKKLYRQALRMSPRLAEAFLALARAELAEGNGKKAKHYLLKVLKLEPQNPRARALLAALGGQDRDNL